MTWVVPGVCCRRACRSGPGWVLLAGGLAGFAFSMALLVEGALVALSDVGSYWWLGLWLAAWITGMAGLTGGLAWRAVGAFRSGVADGRFVGLSAWCLAAGVAEVPVALVVVLVVLGVAGSVM